VAGEQMPLLWVLESTALGLAELGLSGSFTPRGSVSWGSCPTSTSY
jgi:hypothetical protein